MNQEVEKPTSFLEMAHDTFNTVYHKTSWANIMQYGVFFIGGTLTGFLIKKFGKVIFYALMGAALSIGLLYYYKIVSIDWEFVDALGIFPASTLEGVLRIYVNLARQHVLELGLVTIGFLVGYKMA